MMNEEVWRKIPNWEQYEVSTGGQVRSLKRHNKERAVVVLKKAKVREYLGVCLSKKGKCYHFYIHRLVAITFLENDLNLPVVAHINGQSTDNRLENIYWATHAENARDKIKHGTIHRPAGSKNPRAKLKEEDVLLMRKLYREGVTQVQIAQKFNLRSSHVSEIVRNKKWMHI